MGKTFFGHPRGLSILFFTEMWERFSYYGMRALLLLYMVSPPGEGGLGLDEKNGAAIYGLYTMMVYLMALPGGWLADKLLGLRNAIFYGGCIITLGHLCMALNNTLSFFTGLVLVVTGTGLLKPNISSLVGQLYDTNDSARRDAGFSIFFLGINIGAFIAPFITGYLGETIDWHYGFAVAGIGMFAGLVQFKLSERSLGDAGRFVAMSTTKRENTQAKWLIVVFISMVVILIASIYTGVFIPDPVSIANYSAFIIVGLTIVYFAYMLWVADLTSLERKNVLTIAAFFCSAIIFYCGYEQQGSSLNLFAKRYTDMTIGNFEMPASWLQSIPAVAVVILSPVFAWLWVWLSKRGANPQTAVKLSMALNAVGISYIIMAAASLILVSGEKPLPIWLISTYVFHTVGEICLYPVGLSAVSSLAPRKYTGQMMGLWFLSLSLGNLLAGIIAGNMDDTSIAADPMMLVYLFLSISALSFVAAGAIYLMKGILKRLQTP
jgi:proton-dependent oligopeptide transporter, POT family